MARAQAVQLGKKVCPRCAETVKAEATACRHCGYEFTEEEMAAQRTTQAKLQRRGNIGAVVLLVLAAGVGTCVYNGSNQPLTPEEQAANSEKDTAEEAAFAKFAAEGTASEAVRAGTKNPSSFELVGSSAMPGKTDDGDPGWIVGVTYRGTNSFGGVITQNAIVSVDASGKQALKVIHIR